MGPTNRRVTVVVAVAIVATLVPSWVLAIERTESRTRTFQPLPAPASTSPMVRETSGLISRISPHGRVTWRAAEAVPSVGPAAPSVGPAAPSVGPAAPSEELGFDALPRIGPNWPADPTGALGGTVFLAAANSSFAMYTPSGIAALGPEPLSGLFPLPRGTRVVDPKVVYDSYDEHLVMSFLGVNDRLRRAWFLVVAIPDRTPGHVDTWCGSMIPADDTAGDGPQFLDALGLGVDREHVVVTGNRFDFDGRTFRGPQVTAVNKRDVYHCRGPVRPVSFVGNQTLNPDGSLAFALQPAISVGAGNSLYLLSFDPGRPNHVVVWRLRDSPTGLRLGNAGVRVRPVRIAPFATQGGGSLGGSNTWWDPGDLRLTSAFADLPASRLYGAHVVAGDLRPDTITGGYAEAVIRWYEIRVRPELRRSELVRSGTIGVPEADLGWPAIGTDVDGNVYVTYARASAPRSEFLSAWISRILPGATRGSELALAAGSARFEATRGPERWGSYAALGRDPADPRRIAVVNQYALADGSGPTMDWQQTIHVVVDVPTGADGSTPR